MKKLFVLLILFFTGISLAQDISTEKLYKHISFFASDSIKGRKPGAKETRMVAAYILEQFKSYGLKPLGEEGYQFFDVVTDVKLGEPNVLTINDQSYSVSEDFIPLGFSDSKNAEAAVTFVGYGFNIDTDSLKWNDYDGLDVKGKWVLVLMGDPENQPHGGKFNSYNSLRKKTITAKDNGATGVIFVAGPAYEEQDKLTRLAFDQSKSTSGVPVLQVKRDIADKILAGKGKTVSGLEKSINETLKPASFSTTEKVSAKINVKLIEVTTQNVLGLLEGSDETLKNEYVVVGAHYDHLGFGGWGSGSRSPDTVAVHNGADDNASGVGAMLSIAEYFSKTKPKRSILFMSFGAEEMGLLGSKYFTSNPLVNLKKIRIMFNLDMVGRLNDSTNTLTIGGTGTAEGLAELISEESENLHLKVKMSSEGYGPSDHASFYVENIPVLFFFTGTHEDYHKPGDDTEKINFEGIKTVCGLAIDLLKKQVDSDQALVFTEAGPKEEQSRARFKVTLGVVPDYGSDVKGLRLDGIKKGGPADAAGMKRGDIVISMDGKPVTNIYEYMSRLSELKSGQKIIVEVTRDGEKLSLDVTM